MTPVERDELLEALLDATTVFVGIAVRTLDDGALDVTVVQQRILTVLDRHGTLSINSLAEILGVNQSNASRHCTRLEKLGALTRETSTVDRRSVRVALTARGREQVETIREARRRAIHDVLIQVIEPDNQSLAQLLQRFNIAAVEEFEPPSLSSPHAT